MKVLKKATLKGDSGFYLKSKEEIVSVKKASVALVVSPLERITVNATFYWTVSSKRF